MSGFREGSKSKVTATQLRRMGDGEKKENKSVKLLEGMERDRSGEH